MINIVIVEDDYRIGNIHEEFVQKIEGFKVIGKAINAKEAIDLIHSKEVDLLLLDIYMPDLLGTDLMAQIRNKNLNIDIIIISAAKEMEIVEKAIHFGAFDYIIKPVKMDRFIHTLEKFKKVKEKLKKGDTIDQNVLDQYFGYYKANQTGSNEMTPKGIDPITLNKINKSIKNAEEGITAEEAGKKVGVSRTTARRYLEYLISTDTVKAELEYGVVGRPERKYFSISSN